MAATSMQASAQAGSGVPNLRRSRRRCGCFGVHAQDIGHGTLQLRGPRRFPLPRRRRSVHRVTAWLRINATERWPVQGGDGCRALGTLVGLGGWKRCQFELVVKVKVLR